MRYTAEEIIAEDIQLRADAVASIITDHGISMVEFHADFGIHKIYSGKAVLIWLGY